jgi:hypothetical protein
MSEEQMVDVVNEALAAEGIEDTVTAAGEFSPRGHPGAGFAGSREDPGVKVHQRVNVRVLELIDEESGSRIVLEGNRLPITHSKDVIETLSG